MTTKETGDKEMKEITNEMVHAVYETAKKVCQGDLIEEDGVERLTSQYGMNETSAKGYIHTYQYIMQGKKYTRTINEYATKYYLVRILLDNDEKTFEHALNSLKEHIAYQNGFNGIGNIKKIYNTFLEIKKTNYSSIVSKIFELL